MSKKLGQHFLIDENVIEKVSDLVFETHKKVIVEIGCGTGALTLALVSRMTEERLIGVEIDPKLVKVLEKALRPYERARVVEADARLVKFADLPFGEFLPDNDYVLVGNLPYYAALPIMFNFIGFDKPPSTLICMVQQEVADSLCAKVGKRGFIGVIAQTYGELEKVFEIAPESFNPRPQVRSAIVRLKLFPKPLVPGWEIEPFFQFVKRCFSNPRKQLVNAMSVGLMLPKPRILELLEQSGIPPTNRPQDLEIEQFRNLYGGWQKIKA